MNFVLALLIKLNFFHTLEMSIVNKCEYVINYILFYLN